MAKNKTPHWWAQSFFKYSKTQIISAMQHISVAENNLFSHDNILFRLSTALYILPPVILSYFNVISRFLSFTLMYSTDINFFWITLL